MDKKDEAQYLRYRLITERAMRMEALADSLIPGLLHEIQYKESNQYLEDLRGGEEPEDDEGWWY